MSDNVPSREIAALFDSIYPSLENDGLFGPLRLSSVSLGSAAQDVGVSIQDLTAEDFSRRIGQARRNRAEYLSGFAPTFPETVLPLHQGIPAATGAAIPIRGLDSISEGLPPWLLEEILNLMMEVREYVQDHPSTVGSRFRRVLCGVRRHLAVPLPTWSSRIWTLLLLVALLVIIGLGVAFIYHMLHGHDEAELDTLSTSAPWEAINGTGLAADDRIEEGLDGGLPVYQNWDGDE